MSEKLKVKMKVVDIPDPNINREVRFAANDRDLERIIDALKQHLNPIEKYVLTEKHQPAGGLARICNQLASERKRLFRPR